MHEQTRIKRRLKILAREHRVDEWTLLERLVEKLNIPARTVVEVPHLSPAIRGRVQRGLLRRAPERNLRIIENRMQALFRYLADNIDTVDLEELLK